jgi:Zn-dependent protease with chaperone function
MLSAFSALVVASRHRVGTFRSTAAIRLARINQHEMSWEGAAMRLPLTCVIFALTAVTSMVAVPAQAQTWDDLEQSLEGRELVMRPTVEGRRKVYIDLGDLEAFALHRGDRLFPLREEEPVRVIDADPEDDHIELELQSSRLGRGRVDFYGTAPTAENFETWLDEVFEVTIAEAEFHRYVGNRQSQTLHIRGANHLPDTAERELFRQADDGLSAGYHECGVCFVPTPDVSDYQTERSLAMFSLQQVRATYYPQVDVERQEEVERVGARVLDGWPVPLKGYRYRFQVVDADDVNAFAVPTGYIFITRGLLDALESEDELAAILAHEIAHVESRHSYRMWRNSQTTAGWMGVIAAVAGATDNVADDIVTTMLSFTTNLFLAGHGRDRERESDLFASFYLHEMQIGDQPFLSVLKKLKFARDAYDPFGSGGGGLFASHPHIEERLAKASATVTQPFSGNDVFHGLDDDGTLVATLRFDVQRLFGRELDVVATLSTTAELGEQDNVNTLNVRVAGQRLEFKERTAEKIFPSDEVSAVFRNDRASSLIQAPIESVDMNLRNVARWERASPVIRSK